MEIAVLALAGSGTALATGLGALPVSRLGARADMIRPALWGMTVGLMTVASVVGLLLPALDEGTSASVAAGLGAGTAFLLASRRSLEKRDVHVGQLSGAGVRRSVLVFAVLLVHSLPEGFAIGTAFASETEGLGLFVILAIALQNVPEGTSVITAAIGGLLGTAVGLLFAYLVTESLADLGLGFDPPLRQLAVFLLLAVLVGVVAAVVPARRGARLQILEALRAE